MITVGGIRATIEADTSPLEQGVVRAERALSATERRMQTTGRAADTLSARTRQAGREMDQAAAATQRMGVALRGVNSVAGALGVTLGAVGAIRGVVGAVRATLDWEHAVVSMAKTIDASQEQIDELAQAFKRLSEQVPTSAEELAHLGGVAGQLGIETHAIERFVETVAGIAVATNLTAEEAATGFARFANVMQTPQTQFDQIGSTIVDLGNNLATTEREILEFGQRIAGAGRIAGLTEANVLAIAGAMSSVGVQAEAGGTAVQKVLIDMNTRAAAGADAMKDFADVAGMAAEDFADLWRRDAAEAFTLFVEGLATQGDQAAATLERLGLADQRLVRSFLSLANAGDLLRRSVDRGTVAWKENSALTAEVSQFYDTLGADVERLRNKLVNLATDAGEKATPALRGMVAVLSELVDLIPLVGALVVGGAAGGGLVALVRALRGLSVAGTAALMIGRLTTPMGLAVTAGALLASTLVKVGDDAEDMAERVEDAAKRTQAAMGDITIPQLQADLSQTRNALRDVQRDIEISEERRADARRRARAGSNEAALLVDDMDRRLTRLREEEAILLRQVEILEERRDLFFAGDPDRPITPPAPPVDDAEILARLKERAGVLLSIYESLRDRGEDTTPVLSEILRLHRETEGVIAAQGDALTEVRAEALELSAQLQDAFTVEVEIDFDRLSAEIEEFLRNLPPEIRTLLRGGPSEVPPPPGRSPVLPGGGVILNMHRGPVLPLVGARNAAAAGFESGFAGPREVKEAAKVAAKDVAVLVGGLTDLADAAGMLGNETRLALSGVTGLVQQIDALGSVEDKFAKLAGAFGIAGSVAQIGGALLGSLFGDSPAEKQRNEAILQNNRRLEELRAAMDGLRLTFDRRAAVGEAARAAATDRGLTNRLAVSGVAGVMNIDRQILEQFLAPFGVSLTEFEQAAEDAGIQLWDSTDNVIIPAFEQMAEAMGLTTQDLLRFGDAVRDRMDIQSIIEEIFDITDPTEILKARFGIFADAIGDEALAAFGLDDLDLSTEEGREALEHGIRQLFMKFIEDPDSVLPFLGEFESGKEFIDTILSIDGALDRFGDSVEEATGALLGVPQGFRILNLELARFNAMQAETAESFGGGAAPPPGTSGPGRGPAVDPQSGGGRDRPTIHDHRQFTVEVYQQPGEDADALTDRVIVAFRRVAVQDNLTNGRAPTDPWSPV